MSGLPRQVRAVVATATAAFLALGPAGCGGEPTGIVWPEDPSPRPHVAEPSTSPDPTESVVADEILAVVNGFREVEVASYADPQPPHFARRDLGDYLADPLLSRTLETLDSMHRAGIVFEGRPAWELTVAELRLDDTPPTATVRDCGNATDWHSVFRETGDPVPGERLAGEYVSWLQLKLYPEGWLVHDIEKEDGQC